MSRFITDNKPIPDINCWVPNNFYSPSEPPTIGSQWNPKSLRFSKRKTRKAKPKKSKRKSNKKSRKSRKNKKSRKSRKSRKSTRKKKKSKRKSFGTGRYFNEYAYVPPTSGYTDVSGILLGPSAFQWENNPLDRALNA